MSHQQVVGALHCLPPKQQVDAVLNQANPVSGTKYTVLDTKKNVRILSINTEITWTVQPSPLEIHGTIDGIPFLWDIVNPVSGTSYYSNMNAQLAALSQVLGVNDFSDRRAFILEGRSIKIEAEITGGTSDPLEARVKYAKY